MGNKSNLNEIESGIFCFKILRIRKSDISLEILDSNNYRWFCESETHATAWRKCGSAGRQIPIDSDRSRHHRQGLFFCNCAYFLVVDRRRPANSVDAAPRPRVALLPSEKLGEPGTDRKNSLSGVK